MDKVTRYKVDKAIEAAGIIKQHGDYIPASVSHGELIRSARMIRLNSLVRICFCCAYPFFTGGKNMDAAQYDTYAEGIKAAKELEPKEICNNCKY